VEVTPASYGVSIQAFHFWYVISPDFAMENVQEGIGKGRMGQERGERKKEKTQRRRKS
jgi:hypothetical protein